MTREAPQVEVHDVRVSGDTDDQAAVLRAVEQVVAERGLSEQTRWERRALERAVQTEVARQVRP